MIPFEEYEKKMLELGWPKDYINETYELRIEFEEKTGKVPPYEADFVKFVRPTRYP